MSDIDVKRLRLKRGDILVVKTPLENVVPGDRREYLTSLKEKLEKKLKESGLDNQVIVSDIDVEISVIEGEVS